MLYDLIYMYLRTSINLSIPYVLYDTELKNYMKYILTYVRRYVQVYSAIKIQKNTVLTPIEKIFPLPYKLTYWTVETG